MTFRLYPSLKLEPVCLNFYRFLLENIPQASTFSNLLCEIMHLICHESYFSFQGKLYKQNVGVLIGSPMAGPLAEITLRQRLPFFQPSIKLYLHYVDDILVVWKHPDKIDDFADALTMQQYRLSLLKDQHSMLGVHFLDIYIQAAHGTIKTKVYRKSSNKSVLIPNWSNDPISYKKSAFRSLYRRAIMYCSENNDLRQELSYLDDIGRQHGYTILFLRRILSEVRNECSTRSTEANPSNYLPILYHLKNLRVVKTITKKRNKKLAAHRDPTLFNLLRNDKDPLQQSEKNGGYRIPTKDAQTQEEAAYIGVTARNLKKGVEEHKKDISQAKLTTVLAM